jgi:thiol-disulfide isomerase/thioredoxin
LAAGLIDDQYRELHKSVVAGNFRATYCAPCLGMPAELKALHKETASRGLNWISIDAVRWSALSEAYATIA